MKHVLNINEKVMLHCASVGVSAGIFAPQVLENSKRMIYNSWRQDTVIRCCMGIV